MLNLDLPINVLTERPYTYPEALSDLLFTIRALRAEQGLPPVKSLGTTHSPHPNISQTTLQKHAQRVGFVLTYSMDGVMYATLHDVLRALKIYYRGLHLDPSEVIYAASITTRSAMPYLHGRLPKDPSVVITAALVSALNKKLQFTLTPFPLDK